MVGLGGVLVEALGDVALAPAPLDHVAARACSAVSKGAQILMHSRRTAGRYRCLGRTHGAVSHFAADHADDIAEIDLNPVIVHAKDKASHCRRPDCQATAARRGNAAPPSKRKNAHGLVKDIAVEKTGHVALIEIRRPPNNFSTSH